MWMLGEGAEEEGEVVGEGTGMARKREASGV